MALDPDHDSEGLGLDCRMRKILAAILIGIYLSPPGYCVSVATQPFFLNIALNQNNDILLENILSKDELVLEGSSYIVSYQLQVIFRKYLEDRGISFTSLAGDLSQGQLRFVRFEFTLDEAKYRIHGYDKEMRLSQLCGKPENLDVQYGVSIIISGDIVYREIACQVDSSHQAKIQDVVNTVIRTPLEYGLFADYMRSVPCVPRATPFGRLPPPSGTSWFVHMNLKKAGDPYLCK